MHTLLSIFSVSHVYFRNFIYCLPVINIYTDFCPLNKGKNSSALWV